MWSVCRATCDLWGLFGSRQWWTWWLARSGAQWLQQWWRKKKQKIQMHYYIIIIIIIIIMTGIGGAVHHCQQPTATVAFHWWRLVSPMRVGRSNELLRVVAVVMWKGKERETNREGKGREREVASRRGL